MDLKYIRNQTRTLSFAFPCCCVALIVTAFLPQGQAHAATLAAGSSHTVALKNDGTVWTWGYNGLGQLGNLSTTDTSSPVQVSGLTGITSVAAGYSHGVALKSDGTVWSWGYNGAGQLGNGNTTDSSAPVQVSGLSGVTAIAAGQNQTLALKSDGTLMAWGANNLGQLGALTSATCTPAGYACSSTPLVVTGVTGATLIGTGGAHSLALKSDGSLWAWGVNLNGQLGNASLTFSLATPAQMTGLAGITSMASGAGMYHGMAAKSDGTAWAWGYNGTGQLGDGTTTDASSPVQVSGLTGIIALAGGPGHSLALKSDGTVWSWGSNSQGELGNGGATQSGTATQLAGQTGVIAIAGGNSHSVILKNDGTVWSWGLNSKGQLGNASVTTASTPVQVVGSGGSGFLNLLGTSATPPACTLAASPSSIALGATATLTASCSPAATSYTWTAATGLVAGTGNTATVTPAAAGAFQYVVAGNNAGGAGNSASAILTVTAAASDSARLINLSTRGRVQTGDNIMIGGFVIGGSVAKSVLIRAVGPNLANYGVTGVLANPTLKLLSGQTQVASNDDWGSAANAAAIQATGKAPVSALESAILTTLSPGTYTAQVSGVGGGTGVGIIEVFEIDQADSPLINISTRGQVQTGDNVMIGGFVIGGSAAQTVLIRAVGPNLANYGVTGVLANPMLQLYAGQTLIASNDDWGSAANAAAIQATGKAPANPLESAILVTLSPGTYTAKVSGVGGGSGVGIVEVFAQ